MEVGRLFLFVIKYDLQKIVIEVDGIQHTSPENKALDAERDKVLAKWGITVLRYSNTNINENFNSVAEDILKKLNLSIFDLKA